MCIRDSSYIRSQDGGIHQSIFKRFIFLRTSRPVDRSTDEPSIDPTNHHAPSQPSRQPTHKQASLCRNAILRIQHAFLTWFSVLSSLSELSSSVSIALSQDTVGTMFPVAPSPAGCSHANQATSTSRGRHPTTNNKKQPVKRL